MKHTDAQVAAWALRLYSSWIERSPITYAQASLVVFQAIANAKRVSEDGRHVRREAAMALIDALQDAGPSTLQDTL